MPAAGSGTFTSPAAFFATASFTAFARRSFGLRLRASSASWSGLVELAATEGDLGQPVQALPARFDFLLGVGQAVGVDQRQRLAAVDLGLIDELTR